MKGHLRTHALVLIGMLIVQYAVGMYIDLFVPFPEGQVGDQLWGFAWSQAPIAIHIILALLIFAGAVVLCIRAARTRERVWLWASGIGFLAILAAGGSGASFIPSQDDIFSYSMALAFLVAVFAYGWGIYEEVRSRLPYSREGFGRIS
jgi:hypothetical protein